MLDSIEEYQAEIKRVKIERSHLRLVEPSQTRPDEDTIKTKFGRIISLRSSQPELISAVTAILWGSWVGNPFFDIYSVAPDIYSGSARFATEAVWGGYVLSSGLVSMYGLIGENRTARLIGTGMLACVWSFGFFAAINGPSLWTTAPVSYPVLCWISTWAFLQVE